MEREVLISSPWYPVIGCTGMAQSCTRGRSDLPLGNISLPRGWSNTRTVFLGRCSMPQACQCLRGIWTMPLIICFNFWSALKRLGSWTRCLLIGPFQLKYSILFCSILFCSVLFYSILFVSFRFVSFRFVSFRFVSFLFVSFLFYIMAA